jgi:hypothetical protein
MVKRDCQMRATQIHLAKPCGTVRSIDGYCTLHSSIHISWRTGETINAFNETRQTTDGMSTSFKRLLTAPAFLPQPSSGPSNKSPSEIAREISQLAKQRCLTGACTMHCSHAHCNKQTRHHSLPNAFSFWIIIRRNRTIV